MSTSVSSAGNQDPSAALSFCYRSSGHFANPEVKPLTSDAFGHILSFLHPKDLARVESVCRSWKRFIDETDQWKRQCRIHLNLGAVDPITYLPECKSYKEGLRSVFSRVYDEKTYQYYLGAQVEPFSGISEDRSLKRFNERDPCNPTATIGQKYVWMYSPSYFKIPVDEDFPFELDKPDDPNDEEAPRLIKKKVGLVGSFKSETELGSELERKILKVSNTINNLDVLFKHRQIKHHQKHGIPHSFYYDAEAVLKQHGNKRIPQGWICMREDLIGRYLDLDEQQNDATKKGVVITRLGHRVLFNFLKHAKTNTYPDGGQFTLARTSTRTLDSHGIGLTLGCGGGPFADSSAGLYVADYFEYDDIRAAVELPPKKN